MWLCDWGDNINFCIFFWHSGWMSVGLLFRTNKTILASTKCAFLMWFVPLRTFCRYGFGCEMAEESGDVSDWWRMWGIGIDKDVGVVALTLTLIFWLDVWRWWCGVGLRLRLERCNDTGKIKKRSAVVAALRIRWENDYLPESFWLYLGLSPPWLRL